MPGIQALRRLQLGAETTAGTIVAATTIWRGIGTIEDQRETVFPDEHVGIISGIDRSYVPRLAGGLEFESVPATFEQILHILEAGVHSLGVGTVDTGGSGRIWSYALPVSTQNTPQTYTIEGGDDQQAEVMEHAFLTEFSLEGNAGEAVMITATWAGRQVADSGFTGDVPLPVVEEILFSRGKLFIDAVSSSAGTTPAAHTWLAFSLNADTGFEPVYTGDGELFFSFVKQTRPEITLDVTFEHDSIGVAEKNAWRNQTPRLIRLLFEGSAFTTAGSSYANKTLILDLPGKWESFDALGEQNGNDILTGTFRVGYDPTAGHAGRLVVANTLASLP